MARRKRKRSNGLGAQRGEKPRPVMNVTPLVDVVLVLLIIFMVVIPAMSEELDITIPGIFNPDEQTEAEADPYLLSITSNGDMYFEDQELVEEELMLFLQQARDAAPNRRIVVRGDEGVRYGDARRLYRAVQDVGFPGVSLRVNKLGEDS